MASPMSITDTKDATQSRLDVFTVRKYLLRFLPLELVDIILDAAHYWAAYRTSCSQYLQVAARNDPHHMATSCCLVTPRIPQLWRGNELIPTNAKMVKFHFRSCDQGWGGSRENRGTYRGSSTWFTASINRDVKPDQTNGNSLLRGVPPESDRSTVVEKELGVKEWLIQMNMQVSRHKKCHEVVWRVDEEVQKPEYDEVRGCGAGQGFLESLKAGDSVIVNACAQYPGWENHVYDVSVEIFYWV